MATDATSEARCPSCGADLVDRRERWSLPIGRVLALIGGLALVAAYFMAWFGIQIRGQGVVLSGQFLGGFLGSTDDLRSFMPGAAGGLGEVQALRALVFLFPTAGALAALAALVTVARRGWVDTLLLVLGAIPLVALLASLGRLPAGASPAIGLWTIGLGSLLVILGASIDLVAARRPANRSP